jgi:DNA-binding NarL/FixJ family response regulator
MAHRKFTSPATTSPAAATLTPRQQQVLLLIAEGKSTKEIAAALKMSFKTAAVHRSNLMAKLDLHDVASLVRYAIRNGLLNP